MIIRLRSTTRRLKVIENGKNQTEVEEKKMLMADRDCDGQSHVNDCEKSKKVN